ncbi:MAG TPA: NADH-quinone oxidoreductase subunit C [Methanocorpusculum sp.]|nr:NADH-quinone oxidoreductase subunit C [Methanocorpusculum sp.]
MSVDIEMKAATELEQTVAALKNDGYRLVVITCTPAPENYDITYTFDKDTVFRHIRLNEPEEAEIPSITPAFPGAFVYENEIHDLYGFRFRNLSIDFKGTFIRTSVPYPFKKKQPEPKVTVVNKEAKKE